MYKFVTRKNGGLSDGIPSLGENEEDLQHYYMNSADEMADIEIQQQPMGLSRSVGASSLNDTFDLQQSLKDLEDQVARDASLVQEDQSDDEDGDDWLLQDELAKLRAEWDDYVDNLEGELEMEDYPPIDMKERLRKLNEEWGAEEEVVRTNTKVNFSEKLVTLEVPPPEYLEDSDSDLEIESRVAQVMEEEEMRGDGDIYGSEQHKDVVVGDVKGEGDKHVVEDSSTDMYAKQLNVSDSDSKEDERTDLNVDNSGAQITENSQDELENLSSRNNEIKRPEDGGTEFTSETNDMTPEQSKEEQVLIERDGKFELKKVSDLSMEERDIMGIPSPVGTNRNTDNGAGQPDDSSKPTKAEKSKTPARKERPSTAKTYQSPQQQPVQKRRIQSAKSAATENPWQYEKPEGYSKYGLSPEQKELKKKQMMMKSQRLQERRQKEEEEKKRQQEEAESAFQAWVKRKQQEAIERKKVERQKQKGNDVKIQKDPKEAEESYEAWLKAKKQQAKLERKVNKQKKKEEKEAYFYRSRDECDAAFKEWLKTKKKQLREDNAMKRAGSQQTTKTAQKSQKARNLSKALQVAQTYKYTDYYGYRF